MVDAETNSSHRHHGRPRPTSRPSVLSSVLHFFVLTLPPVLYLSGFILTLVTTGSHDFVRADQLTSPPPGDPVRFTNTTLHASLWHTCTVTSSPPDEQGNVISKESCVRRFPLYGAAGIATCEAQTNFNAFSRICEKVVTAAELYLAATVLGGVALASAILFGLGEVALWKEPGRADGGEVAVEEREHLFLRPFSGAVKGLRRSTRWVVRKDRSDDDEGARVCLRAWGAVTSAVALAAAGCLVMGQILGVEALAVEGSVAFTADFVPDGQTRWYLGRGALQLTSAAYLTIFSGAFVALTRFGIVPV